MKMTNNKKVLFKNTGRALSTASILCYFITALGMLYTFHCTDIT